MNTEYTRRYFLVGIALSILPLLIIFKLIGVQTNPQQVSAFTDQSKLYEGEYHTFYPARGQIYDRWGNLLAGNKTVYQIGIELKDVRNPQTIALTLNVVLGLDYSKVLAAASMPPSNDAVYAVVTDFVSPDKVEHLNQLAQQIIDTYSSSHDKNPPSLSGLKTVPHLMRSYPEKDVASNLLGFVSQDNKGYFGVEEKYNELLAGKPKTVWMPLDPNRVSELPNIPDGANLVLTLDRAIQAEMERILDKAIQTSGSKSGTIVIEDPKTGEILALATTPRIDLNYFSSYFDTFNNNTPFDRGVSQAYEPGSVYKVLTMATALDTGAVKPQTSFLDKGVFEIGGTYIYNWNGGAWGPQNMTGCLEHSLNVCLAWIATQTGAKNFYQYMQNFGIGHLTGIDLAGEVPGRLKIPGDADWYDADLGTNSFGQGVSATPLQMAAAISAVANDGKMMAPHIVRSMVNKGYQYDMDQRVIGMPIKPETAHTLSEMLAQSLEKESSDALVPGYRVAGKTGTAEIPTPMGYTSNATNASFVGWGPVDDPRFLVYIWLEKPTTSPWGSVVAAPVFSEVVQRLVVLMNIPPDDVRHQLLGQ
jgi:cell division protein FtsI/penicillin-binding protein 2